MWSSIIWGSVAFGAWGAGLLVWASWLWEFGEALELALW